MTLVAEASGELLGPERLRLAELEAVVEHGLTAFVDVGAALLEIRDARLYRETHATFEAYLDERWSMSRANGYRMIDAARVAEVVSPIGDIANEAQSRELVPLLRDEGELAVVEVYRELRERFGEGVTADRVRRLVRRRMEREERTRASAERRSSGDAVPDDVDIRHGDFRDVLADLDGEVDAIVTDPPYAHSWIERDADDFAAACARWLKPTGSLVVMFGHLGMYDLKAALDGHMRYRWTCAYLLPGCHRRIFQQRLATGWKPVLVYEHADADGPPEFLTNDVFVSDAADKEHHHWGQSESGTARLVEAFSHPGDLVLDPFLGGGTTAVVCHGLGRRFVGCDVDAQAVAASQGRLAAEHAEVMP